MRFTSFSLFALGALVSSTFAAPTAASAGIVAAEVEVKTPITEVEVETGDERRADVLAPVVSILEDLLGGVKEHCSNINQTVTYYVANATSNGTTVDGIYLPVGSKVPDADKKAIVKIVKKELFSIISLIQTAVSDLEDLDISLSLDVDIGSVVSLVLELIGEIIYTLQPVISIVGTVVFSVTLPLVSQIIVALLTTLNNILGGILPVVGQLLSGILGPVLNLVGEILTPVLELLNL